MGTSVPSRVETDEIADADGPAGAELEADVERREAVVPAASHGARLDHVLVGMAGEFSRRHLQQLIAAGHARLDDRVVDSPAQRTRAGQRVAVELVPTAESRAFAPQALPIAVVYEDEHVLVVDKAAGMVVHPAAGNWSGTLLNALLHRDPRAAGLPRAGIVHRLDKDTSGLMVVGRTLAAVTGLARAIAAREVGREYLAIVHGDVQPSEFTIEAPIGRDPRVPVRMAVVAGGRPARTDVSRVAAADGASALRCRLHTGRTHQIRVHLAARGHPLVGDATYGGRAAFGIERQALHAARLAFRHPASGRHRVFEASLPCDLAAAWSDIARADADRRRD